MAKRQEMPPVQPGRPRRRNAKGDRVKRRVSRQGSVARATRGNGQQDPVDVAPTCPSTRAAGNALVGDGMSPSIRAVYRSELADKARVRRHKVSSKVRVVRNSQLEPAKYSRGAGYRRSLRWENASERPKVRWEGPDPTTAGRLGRDQK